MHDVRAIVTRNKQARAYALGDALGDRDLPASSAASTTNSGKCNSTTRNLRLASSTASSPKSASSSSSKKCSAKNGSAPPATTTPSKPSSNASPPTASPRTSASILAINAYVLYKALPQVRRYTQDELVQAMQLLLDCNRRLIFNTLDASLLLQQTLVQIIRAETPVPSSAAT